MLRIFYQVKKYFLECEIVLMEFLVLYSPCRINKSVMPEDIKVYEDQIKDYCTAKSRYFSLLRERYRQLEKMTNPEAHIIGHINRFSLKAASRRCAKFERERKSIATDLERYCKAKIS